MFKNVLVILISSFTFIGFSQNIPTTRTTDWSGAGAKCSFYDTTVNIMDFGGDSLGVNDNSLALTNAILSLTNGGTVYFPLGAYFFNSTQNIPSGIKIKGNGASNTEFKFDLSGSGNLFQVHGSAQSTIDTVLGGYLKDSKVLTVTNASLYNSGDYIRMVENDNGRIYSSWANNSIGQIVEIDSVSLISNELFINQPLRQNYTNTLYPRINKLTMKTNVAFECFSIERIDQTTSQSVNISLTYAANCIVKGIESKFTNFSHVKIQNATNISVLESHFKDSHGYGGGGRAYGVVMQSTSGYCLVENNQFDHLRHSVLLQSSANGNVIAYNYSKDPFWTGSVWLPSNSAGDLVLHGNYAYMNLFEGNICQNIVIDNSHGINGPYNTFFRNRAELYGIFMNTTSVSDSQNFVGNEVTNTSTGLYSLAGTGHFAYGNNHNGTIKPAGATVLPQQSYYKTHEPLYWNKQYNWPSIGIPNVFDQTTIPAKENNELGNLSFCYGDTLYYNEVVCYGDTFYVGDKAFFGTGNYFDSINIEPGCLKYVAISLAYTLKPTITVTWFLESSVGVKYKWYLNGQILTNDTTKIIGINSNGYYQVEVTNSNGCTSISDSVNVVSTSIESETGLEFKIYPNPTQDVISIEFKQQVNEGYTIFDSRGKIVLKGVINSEKQTINLTKLEKGIYYLNILGTNKYSKVVLN